MTSTKAIATPKTKSRGWHVAAAATLMMTASPLALHAETSNAQLAKEIADLKAQIRSMKGSIAVVRKQKVVVRTVAPAYVPPATFTNIPPGATPVYATADKKMIFGNLVITPGGFVDLNFTHRTAALGGESNSNVNGIPTLNLDNAHFGESRFTARNTRLALLIEAPIAKNFLVSGYGELDFRASGITSTPGITNTWVPRLRLAYLGLDANDYGLHVQAGQTYSLVTPNSKGITPRNEVLPPVLDNVVLPGFDYARSPGIRIVKDFDKKLWLALSLESPQTQGATGSGSACAAQQLGATTTNAGLAANTFTGIAGGNCYIASTSGDFGGAGQAAGAGLPINISNNNLPNVIGKIAYEARLGDRDVHVEALGLFKNAETYVNYGPAVGGAFPFSTQKNTPMGGVGGNIVAPILVGKLDFQAGGNYGTGFGYYTSSGLPDGTVGADGRVHGLRGESAYAGVIAHATPSFDIYAYAGIDQVQRNYSTLPNGTQVGYGTTALGAAPATNGGCTFLGGTCSGVTHRVWQLTGGFIDKLYKGSYGEVRASMQYSYTKRDLFAGAANTTGPTAAVPLIGASGVDHVVMTSLRYFPFQ